MIDSGSLKESAAIVSPYLNRAFQRCILDGVFPESMKVAKVFP